MGTSGTLVGMSRRLKELNKEVQIIGVEPYLGHKIQGLKNMKEAYRPGIFDRKKLDEKVNINDDDAYETSRLLAREEGLFVGMSAGAAAVMVMERAKAESLGLKPMAHIVDYMFYGVDPGYFPEGPAVTIPRHLKKMGMTVDDITAFEINEAFAVVNAICINEAGIPWEKTNLHGGGISLGHPTGYTGARLTLHLANILKPGEYGLAAACGGGGLTGSLIVQGE